MTPERWHQIEELFQAAVDRPPAEQDAFISWAAGADRRLHEEVRRLIAADALARSYMEGTAVEDHPHLLEAELEAAEATTQPEDLASELGAYRIVELLGEGGMGAVYLAEQTEPFERQVAIKFVRPALDWRRAVAGFRAEGMALSRMNHTNIARVFEAGATASGQPYLVMEYVHGPPLAQYCDERRLGLAQRLTLFIAVCHGVQHLHQKAVIHRDLKPSNVLVAEEGGRAVPKIIDFGIAKAVDQPRSEEHPTTGRLLLGTPAYLSPETILASSGEGEVDLDTRSDVYSLGVMLYELLVGVLPFGGAGERGELVNRVLAEDPLAPSARLQTLPPTVRESAAKARGGTPSTLARALRRDLDWITLRAMAKKPGDRYASAAQLASELERYRRSVPVLAAPPSRTYRLRRFVRRHLVGAGATLAIAASLIAGIALRTVEVERANREADRANQAAETAEHVIDSLVDLLKLSDPRRSLGPTLTVRELLDQGAETVSRSLADQPLVQARLMDTMGVAYNRLALFGPAQSLLQQALKLRQKHLGDAHPDVGRSLQNLAELELNQGRLARAEVLFKRALAVEETAAEGEGLPAAASLHGLADVYRQKGSYRQAEELLRRTLGIERSLLGNDHPAVATTLASLANLYSEKGQYNKAKALFERALAVRQKVFDPEHPEIASSLYNLAVNATNRGAPADAEPLFRRVLQIQESSLGKEHPMVASTLHSLASLYKNEGRYAEAIALEERALALRERVLGPGHSEVARSCNNLAELYKRLGRFDEAEALFRRARNIWEKNLGSQHILVAASLNNTADLYLAQRRYAEAGKYFRRSLQIVRDAFGPGHPYGGHPLVGLAETERAQGRRLEAIGLFEEALDIWKKAEGYGHPEVDTAQREYASLLREMGRHREARALERESTD